MNETLSIIVTEHDGADERTCVLNVRILDKIKCGNDITEAARKAVHAFLCTPEGRDIYLYNCKCFNWMDFWDNVPNAFCQEYGFEKLYSGHETMNVDWDEHLADDNAVEAFWGKE